MHRESVAGAFALLKIGARVGQLGIAVENPANCGQISLAHRLDDLSVRAVQRVDVGFERAPTGESISACDVKLSFSETGGRFLLAQGPEMRLRFIPEMFETSAGGEIAPRRDWTSRCVAHGTFLP